MQGYKFLTSGVKSYKGDCAWKIGQWKKHDGPLTMCESGFHYCKLPLDALDYNYGPLLAVVEVRGEEKTRGNKTVAEQMRIVKVVDAKAVSVRFAVACARRVLPNYEKAHPKDYRVRKAIEAAEAWLEAKGRSAESAVLAARAAEWAALAAESATLAALAALAARSAEWAAEWAAESAARAAEWAALAAESAARATESATLAAEWAARATESATLAAEWAAARAAESAARSAARATLAAEESAERDWQNKTLRTIIDEAPAVV